MKVALGMDLFAHSLPVLLRLGFRWNPVALAWVRPGLPMLSNLAGPLQHFKARLVVLGFRWDLVRVGWYRSGLPLLSNLAGPVQHFRAAILDAWRNKVAADLCGREGFRGGPLLDIHGSLHLLNSSHVRERDKALLRSVMVGDLWNEFSSGKGQGPAGSVSVLWCSGW